MRISARTPPPIYICSSSRSVSVAGTEVPPTASAETRLWPNRAGCGSRHDQREVRRAATRSEEGLEEGPPVRAHQGFAARPRQLRGSRRGDRRADRQQGTGPKRRGERVVAALARGHLVGTPRWHPQPPEEPAGAHARPAVRGSAPPQHQGPIEDDQSAARACSALAPRRFVRPRRGYDLTVSGVDVHPRRTGATDPASAWRGMGVLRHRMLGSRGALTVPSRPCQP